MEKSLKCPVCGKPLTQAEYDKALGLWKDKQEHIKHLEEEQKKLKEERRKLKTKELEYKRQAKKQAIQFKKQQEATIRENKRTVAKQAQAFKQQMKAQKDQITRTFNVKMKSEIEKGVHKGVAAQKRQFIKQERELKKTQNKMLQLENSLKVSSKKYQDASEEIKRLKEQIEKGITPQIEGLLEENILLAKLKELYPKDHFDHPGKGGDIIQIVIEQGKEIGKIVYECKKVKIFDKKHIEQAKTARNQQKADFAILVTNAFPSKKQYYFVEKNVFVISPVSLEPITYTLRESLVKMALLKMSNEAKEKAVQRVYDYLSSNDYNNKMNDVAGQLLDLGKELKSEISSHKRAWIKRYHIYRTLFNDIGIIDHSLKQLVHRTLESKQHLLPEPKRPYIEIEELRDR